MSHQSVRPGGSPGEPGSEPFVPLAAEGDAHIGRVVDHDAGEMGPDTEVVVLVDAAERAVEAADPEEYVTGDSEIPTHEHWKGFVRVRSFGW
ncbi:hypothetical protein M3C13_002600 [Micrococcus luteus]|nr:hypothetical protein [Micrococcus luteus]MCV7451037.1 hypothetical protein [Micrococcus luteus]